MSFGLLVFRRCLQNVRLAALDLDITKGDGLSSPKIHVASSYVWDVESTLLFPLYNCPL